jgi:hypothetical protein
MKKNVILLLLLIFTLSVKAQTSAGQPKVLVDNDKIKVTRFISDPGKDVCGAGKHSHPAHLTVLLTDATVTITQADGKVITRKAPAGTSFWSGAETHEVINSGKIPMKVLIIETK